MTNQHSDRVTGFRSFLTFTSHFFHYCFVLRWLLGMQFVLVLLGGLAIARCEDIHPLQGIYFSLITSTTVGYGDIIPSAGISQIVSVLLAILGTILFGLVIAVATQAFTVTIEEYKTAKESAHTL